MEDAGPQVALTFDDCDQPEAWGRILDVLGAHGSRATFFPNGFRAEQQPQLASRTVAEGHSVGSHGWDHTRLPQLPPEEIRRRLLADRRLWERVAGMSLRLLRPPFGESNPATMAEAAEAGYTDLVLWDVDPADWRDPDPRTIVDRVEAVREGSIVALHVVEATATALPEILDRLRGRGLDPASLDELIPP